MRTSLRFFALLGILTAFAPAHAQGRNWEVIPISDRSENLTAISFLKNDLGATVSGVASVFRFDGVEWTRIAEPQPFGKQVVFSGVVVPDASRVWVCSGSPQRESRGLAVYSEEAWEVFPSIAGVANPRVNGLWSHPESGLMLAALSNGRIARRDGEGWSCADLNLSGSFLAIHGSDAKNIWAVGEGGMIYFSDDGGITWADRSDSPEIIWQAVHTLAPDKTWMVGRGGEVAFWDGERLTIENPVKTILRGVFAVSPTEVYVVGSAAGPGTKGTFLAFNGSSWHVVEVRAHFGTLNAITSDPDGNLYAVGNGGIILRGSAD